LCARRWLWNLTKPNAACAKSASRPVPPGPWLPGPPPRLFLNEADDSRCFKRRH
jgi:hypothetical protein